MEGGPPFHPSVHFGGWPSSLIKPESMEGWLSIPFLGGVLDKSMKAGHPFTSGELGKLAVLLPLMISEGWPSFLYPRHDFSRNLLDYVQLNAS
ncbi:hypothetical protein SUGI_0424200 [Cryptomeria japonica]|nr:hypothetical protein SUGI_0424200 [Cryptomeria japonica]